MVARPVTRAMTDAASAGVTSLRARQATCRQGEPPRGEPRLAPGAPGDVLVGADEEERDVVPFTGKDCRVDVDDLQGHARGCSRLDERGTVGCAGASRLRRALTHADQGETRSEQVEDRYPVVDPHMGKAGPGPRRGGVVDDGGGRSRAEVVGADDG